VKENFPQKEKWVFTKNIGYRLIEVVKMKGGQDLSKKNKPCDPGSLILSKLKFTFRIGEIQKLKLNW